MQTKNHIFQLMVLLLLSATANAQVIEYIPDLKKVKTAPNWQAVNREITVADHVSLNAQTGDGLLYLNDFEFRNGSIELDIKGKNDPGKSFVGLAFHILNDSTFDAIYFRPFNFKNPDRNGHSVQYISMPENNWYNLRETHPGKYENKLSPIPKPEEWFHAKIEVEYPTVKVFVNHSKKASLVIDQLSMRKKGMLGFWVGNGSEGSFKNLKILNSIKQ